MSRLFRRLLSPVQRRDREAELKDELSFHLTEEANDREARGLGAEQARRAARLDLGNLTLVQEETRAVWLWTWLEQFGQDIRYGLRTMRSNKAFSALAILSLALGIGANTAIFSFMHSILLRRLPVPDPQSLVILSWRTPNREFHGTNRHNNSYTDPKGGFIGGFFAYPAFELIRKNDSVFSVVFGYQGAGRLNLSFQERAEIAETEYVSGDYFRGLGIAPEAGRLIVPDDDRAGAAAVAVISFGLSQRSFGGPSNAPGQSILINNQPFTVIGVAPPQFYGADPNAFPDVYIPFRANLLLEAGDRFFEPAMAYVDPKYDWVVPMARLRPGVSASQAQAAVAPQFFEWARSANPKRRAEETPVFVVREGAGGLDSLKRQYSKPLYVLLGLVALILAIACANMANLLLSRAAARKREIAVRLSIGAGRLRVLRQLLTESVLLAVCGGALGILFAYWGIDFLTLLMANGRENFTVRADLNWYVLGAALGLSLLTGVLFGLAPALQSTRLNLTPALRESRTGETGGRGFRGFTIGRLLIISQIAFTLLILFSSGLFLRTLSNLASIELGFNRDNVLTFSLNARQAGHEDPEIADFYEGLRKQFSAIPGVRSATLSQSVLIGQGTSASQVTVNGSAPASSRILNVGADFHATLGIPILLGRPIDSRDRAGAPLVAVVNQEFVRSRLGDRNPLGQRIALPRACPKCDIQIVGVSANTLYGNLKGKPEPTVYLSFAQNIWPVGGMAFQLLTAVDPLSQAKAVREVVRRADDRMPVADIRTQQAWIDQSMNQEITFARLCTAFALLALAIACIGLYGTMSYNVARRTGEIGIRMALGAQRKRVVWMVLREVFGLAAVGLAISLPVALAASKVVESFLYGMKPNDPMALAGSAAALVCAVVLAGYVPARRASRIDPMVALRHE